MKTAAAPVCAFGSRRETSHENDSPGVDAIAAGSPRNGSPGAGWHHLPRVLGRLSADYITDDGRRPLMRHGHLPEHEISIGLVAVCCPRVRDGGGEGSERIRFSSAILPPYARRSKSLEVLIPILYLKGISTGDFEDALSTVNSPLPVRPRPRG
jgi:hypothetical protein